MMAVGIRGIVRIVPDLNPDEDAVMPVMPVMLRVPALVLPHVTLRMAINMRLGAVMRAPLYMGARLMTRTGLRRYTQPEYGTCQDDSGNKLFQHGHSFTGTGR
jgi:hypothetical protein